MPRNDAHPLISNHFRFSRRLIGTPMASLISACNRISERDKIYKFTTHAIYQFESYQEWDRPATGAISSLQDLSPNCSSFLEIGILWGIYKPVIFVLFSKITEAAIISQLRNVVKWNIIQNEMLGYVRNRDTTVVCPRWAVRYNLNNIYLHIIEAPTYLCWHNWWSTLLSRISFVFN